MKNISKILNIFVSVLIVYLLANRLPNIINQYKTQGQQAPTFKVQTLANGEFNLASNLKPIVVVFWATWCGPCKVELKRIQNLINQGHLEHESVLAISSNEDRNTVLKSVAENKYTFTVGIDSDGSIFNLYNVKATPTIMLLDSNNKIKWITTGLSPTLEMRIKSFIE